MKMHKAVLDISARLVNLDSPIFSKISLQFPPVAHLQASIHVIIAKTQGEIHVVHKYPDVFPDDLPGMPPDRAIEFKIKLQSGTAPIYKQWYPTAPNELAEMKTQLQVLAEIKTLSIRGIFDPAVHHGVVPLSLLRRRTRHCTCVSITNHSMW
jgi:hypothetical protein